MTKHTPNAQITQEIWKDVPGYAGRYQVSNCGRVRSLYYCGHWRKRPKIRKPDVTTLGYVRYILFFDGVGQGHFVHRLVMAAFVGESELEVNHKDGDKRNNWLGNLEYVTRSENLVHATYVLGCWSDEHPLELVERNKKIWEMSDGGMNNADIAKHFGLSAPRVWFIVNKKRRWLPRLQER